LKSPEKNTIIFTVIVIITIFEIGEIPERSKGTDCKSVGSAFAGSNPALATKVAGIAQLVEWQPSKL
jgi:hypothetical protein